MGFVKKMSWDLLKKCHGILFQNVMEKNKIVMGFLKNVMEKNVMGFPKNVMGGMEKVSLVAYDIFSKRRKSIENIRKKCQNVMYDISQSFLP